MAELPYLDDSTAVAPPIPFTASGSTADFELKSNKGAANGYAPLNASGIVPSANLPPASDLSNYQETAQKNAANGYAGLGADGKIALSQLPDANALESEAIAFAIALG